MKKIFAIFLALVLMPSFHAYAWLGGPFSNNSFTPAGDDGVYEAVAVPASSYGTNQFLDGNPVNQVNGIGLYRWAVSNNNTGSLVNNPATGIQEDSVSNVHFGGLTGSTNQKTWYINGKVYYGTCFGVVNSVAGAIRVVGTAAPAQPILNQQGFNFFNTDLEGNQGIQDVDGYCNSYFTGYWQSNDELWYAGRNFEGYGSVTTINTDLGPFANVGNDENDAFTFEIFVFGSRVSIPISG